MADLAEICEATITFYLPDWFPPERLEWSRTHYYPDGHVWAGSFEGRTYHNSAEDAIGRFKEFDEACFDHAGPWVRFKVPVKNFERHVAKLQRKLDRFLHRYKESRELQATA